MAGIPEHFDLPPDFFALDPVPTSVGLSPTTADPSHAAVDPSNLANNAAMPDRAGFDGHSASIATLDWPELAAQVAGCQRCGLCRGRVKTVFGVGDVHATWLFIGEGPGYYENQQGEPFVGRAGQLLDNMLNALGVVRGDRAYIANIVKCRPTDANGKDRPPTPQEVAACLPYLQRQIALIQPKIIVALGKTAVTSLFGLDPQMPLAQLRGKVMQYRHPAPDGGLPVLQPTGVGAADGEQGGVTGTDASIPLVATYHPAYLLRQPSDKRKAWTDLCLARSQIPLTNEVTYDN